MDKTCGGYTKIIRTKYVGCEHCVKYYRPACTTLQSILNNQNNVVNACRSCISAANANKQKRDSTSEKDDPNGHPTATNSSTESLSDSCTNATTSSTDLLHQILEKLTKLESLDNRFIEMQVSFDTRLTDLPSSFDTRFTEVKTTSNTRLEEVSTRISILEGRLAPLDDLPFLSTRLSAAEEATIQVQSEQTNLRSTTNSTAALDVTAVRRMEKLEHDIQHLNAALRSLSNELVITELRITDTISPKGAVCTLL